MKQMIARLIHSSQGYCHETAGMILCFFSNAQQARRCALLVRTRSGKSTEVCGSQLSIFL